MGTQPSTINRRSFITGMLAAGAALSTGALVGCGGEPRNAQDSASNPSAPTSKDWTSPPSPVEDGEITETVEADIVIIGAGTSGIPAALTAVEGGAQKRFFSKKATPTSPRQTGLQESAADTKTNLASHSIGAR